MSIYTTRDEAIERVIIEPLGEYGDQHDIDAIADEVLESGHWLADDEGEYVPSDTPNARYGYRLNPTVDFWAAVESHAKGGE